MHFTASGPPGRYLRSQPGFMDGRICFVSCASVLVSASGPKCPATELSPSLSLLPGRIAPSLSRLHPCLHLPVEWHCSFRACVRDFVCLPMSRPFCLLSRYFFSPAQRNPQPCLAIGKERIAPELESIRGSKVLKAVLSSLV